MKKLFKNWKTTFFGLTTIATGVMLILKGHVTEGVTAISTGLGLTVAKDHTTID